MIDPTSLAFDIDSVFADTMRLFLDIARNDFNIEGILYDDITSYTLTECIGLDASFIQAIIDKIQDGSYTTPLKPIPGAPEVLTKVGEHHSPVLFVTARPSLGPIDAWIHDTLPLEPWAIEIIATGSFEGKANVLLDKRISYFVEDRLETCFHLKEVGVTPIVFRQPWNRKQHPFMEVSTWNELESLIEF